MPTLNTLPPSVAHNPDASRFECTVDGHLCVAEYRLAGTLMIMHHTLVAPALEGRGIAAALVAAALQHARAAGWRVRPTCSYVARYMQRHAETQDLLAP